MALIAVFKESRTVTEDDGCTGSWVVGDVLTIECGGAVLDYVRKGVLVPLATEGHFHAVPSTSLSFFQLVDGKRFPVGTDSLFRL